MGVQNRGNKTDLVSYPCLRRQAHNKRMGYCIQDMNLLILIQDMNLLIQVQNTVAVFLE